jgi:hypothetical protein
VARWNTFTQDQLALLDHLGVYRCLLCGSCIGPSYAFALMQAALARASLSSSAAIHLRVLNNSHGSYVPLSTFSGWALSSHKK